MNEIGAPAREATRLAAEALTRGTARAARERVGVVLEPLSFWGGYDSVRGTIVEPGHPDCGRSLAGSIMVTPRAKGSSSSSSVLAEAIRRDTGPAGIILLERDSILAIGAIAAGELYGIYIPLVVVDEAAFAMIRAHGGAIEIDAPDDTGPASVTLLANT